MPTRSNQLIRVMVKNGYHMSDDGILYNPKGEILTPKQHAKQSCPKVTAHYYDNGKRKSFKISAHRLAAYYYYGEDALKQGTDVIWVDNNKLNIKQSNLLLAKVQRKVYGGTKK